MKKNPVIPLLVLAALAATSSYAQRDTRNLAVSTLAELDGRRPLTGETVWVGGITAVGDWGEPRAFYYDSTSSAAVNDVVRAAAGGVGRYIHKWDGDVRTFNVLPDDASKAAANGAGIERAVAYAKTTGIPLKFSGGGYYLDRPINAQDITKISGAGKIGNQYETIIYITATNTSAITNLSTGGTVENLHLRPLYYSYAKQSTVGYGVHGASGSSAQTLRNLYIEGFPIGVGLSTFDSLLEDVDVIAARPFVVGGGGTQNTFVRCSARGNIVIAGLTDNTSITGAVYTAGSTNLTVTDASTISVGDYIRVRDCTEYSNTITYRFFHRKVTGKSGNDLTINYPWELGFTNGRFEFALGAGYSAFEGNTEMTLVGCNAEYGAWQHIISNNSGPTASLGSAGVLHIEGWVADAGSGANNYVFNGVNTSVTAQAIDMANITIFSSAGAALVEGGTRGYVDILHLRDFDQYQSVPYFYAGAWNLTKTYSGALVINDINNAGAAVLQRTVDGTQWRNTVSDFKFGKGGELVTVDGSGIGNARWYGYSATPTGGNFIQGDKVITANEVIRALSTGSFQTAAGSNRIFNGSSILLVDQDARGVLGRRTPVSCLATNGTNVSTVLLGVVKEQLRNSPDTNALVAAAASGSKMIKVADASGVQQGDPGIVIEGSTFSDVTVARVASPYIFFTSGLTNAFTTNAVFYTGVQLYAAVTNDLHWQAVKFSPPTFITELDYLNRQWVGGPGVGVGLTVEGGASGSPVFSINRPGAGTNSILVGDGQLRIRNNADNRQIASFTPSGSDHYWTVGDSSAQTSPRQAIIQSEPASGTNTMAKPLVLRAGQSTGNASPTNKVAISLSVATNANLTALQSSVDVATFQPPLSPGTGQSILKMYFWDGSFWTNRHIWYTNIGGVNYLIVP